VVWGAFVAGLKAGKYYPTFPFMGGRLVPAELRLDALLEQLVSTPIGVQWLHRVLGTLLLLAVAGTFLLFRARVADAVSRRYNAALAALVVVQYGLGVATLLYLVPVSLGVIHQATAMVLFGVWLAWLHHVIAAGRVAAGAPAREPAHAPHGH
jgi:heme a synthase